MAGDSGIGRHVSLWLDSAPASDYPPLDGERRFDVAVVGAGITGLTAALLLARDGLSVGVVDQQRVGAGTTGHTTGKVSSQHSVTYARIRRTHGEEGARAYGASMEAAKERIAALVAEGIDCDFRRRAAYLYATRALERRLVEKEADAARQAGLPASYVETTPLPFDVKGALRFEGQAELHAQRYLLGLAQRLEGEGGRIFERTRAIDVDGGGPYTVRTERAPIHAQHVVVATLMPFLDRGGFFARAFPSRSYAITARVGQDLPEGMFINAAPPIRSIRAVPYDGAELLVLMGESHHTGAKKALPERYAKLREFGQAHWDLQAIEHHWSAQDYSPADGVPYIGPLRRRSRGVYVATGFKKWGLTGGTLAAMLITDAIAGRDNPWAELFDSKRLKLLAEGPRVTAENARVGARFFGDRLRSPGRRDIEDLALGEGAVVSSRGRRVAGYRGEDGKLHAVSTRCTHLACQVAWNAAERTWDCPCHGSRFGVDGEILNGPAVKPLEKRPI